MGYGFEHLREKMREEKMEQSLLSMHAGCMDGWIYDWMQGANEYRP